MSSNGLRTLVLFASFSLQVCLENKSQTLSQLPSVLLLYEVYVSMFPRSLPQFHDKIDPMLESLERIAERLRQPPSISVEVDKIKEQITENKAVSVDLEKLQPSYETLRQRGEEMIARSEGADKDISAKGMLHIILSYLFDRILFHFLLAVLFFYNEVIIVVIILQQKG